MFNKGFIEQIGTPNEIYNHSATEFVCNFIGDINALGCTVVQKLGLDEGMHHFIRLERIRINDRSADTDLLTLPGKVESREYYGLYIKYYIRAGEQVIKAIEKNDGINLHDVGDEITVSIHKSDIMSYPAKEG